MAAAAILEELQVENMVGDGKYKKEGGGEVPAWEMLVRAKLKIREELEAYFQAPREEILSNQEPIALSDAEIKALEDAVKIMGERKPETLLEDPSRLGLQYLTNAIIKLLTRIEMERNRRNSGVKKSLD